MDNSELLFLYNLLFWEKSMVANVTAVDVSGAERALFACLGKSGHNVFSDEHIAGMAEIVILLYGLSKGEGQAFQKVASAEKAINLFGKIASFEKLPRTEEILTVAVIEGVCFGDAAQATLCAAHLFKSDLGTGKMDMFISNVFTNWQPDISLVIGILRQHQSFCATAAFRAMLRHVASFGTENALGHLLGFSV